MGYIGPDLYSTGKLAGNLTSYLVGDRWLMGYGGFFRQYLVHER